MTRLATTSRFVLISFLVFFVASVLADPPTYYLVERVVDGDTIVLVGVGKVRLLGVDTPETKDPRKPVQYFGKEASAFTKKLLEGKKVRLEGEPNKVDFFKRTLAYVYLEDGTFANQLIIEQGYGHAYTKYPFSRMEAFRKYERTARENKRGLWADDALRTPSYEPTLAPTSKARSKALQAPQGVIQNRAQCVEKKCSEIKTCEEAKFLLKTCGYQKLDKDKNGIPCESLCR